MPRYDSNTKTERNRLILRMWREGEHSQKEIGAVFGISKQRVSNIIKDNQDGKSATD